MIPTFIGIGPGRTATTMLYELFREHPEIFMAEGTKETNFFDRNWEKGREWYEKFFAGAGGYKAVGEISTTYFYDPLIPARIKEVAPGARLLTCLRNPFDRLRSVFLYRQRAGNLPPGITLEDAVARLPEFITDNNYSDHLQDFLTCFNRRQILIQFYDDLLADPEGFVAETFRFIGVDDRFRSPTVRERINPAAVPRSRLAGLAAAAGSRTLRAVGLLRLLTTLKRSGLVRRAVLQQTSSLADNPALHLSAAAVRRLRDLWEPQLQGVEKLCGRSFPSWRQPSAAGGG